MPQAPPSRCAAHPGADRATEVWRGGPATLPQPPCGQINPSVEMSYTLARGIFDYAATVFTDNVVHMGFDEVFESCWDTSPELKAWMAQRGMDYKALMQYHLDRMMAITQPLGRDPIFWQEAFDWVPSGRWRARARAPHSPRPALRAHRREGGPCSGR